MTPHFKVLTVKKMPGRRVQVVIQSMDSNQTIPLNVFESHMANKTREEQLALLSTLASIAQVGKEDSTSLHLLEGMTF